MQTVLKILKKVWLLFNRRCLSCFRATYYSNNKTYKIGSCKHSDISTFSFHPVKSITTGEGGAITTNTKKIFDKIMILRSIGVKRSKDHWDYDVEELSLNFRLSDIQCALGISQLKKLNKFIKKKKRNISTL